ncbi:hypothetical protein CMEL01_07680, partial [Colletotrichum melonis]
IGASTRIELRQETSRPFSAKNFSASNLTQQAAFLLSSSLSLPTSFSERMSINLTLSKQRPSQYRFLRSFRRYVSETKHPLTLCGLNHQKSN